MASVVRLSDRVSATVARVFRERCQVEDTVEYEIDIRPVRTEEDGDDGYEMMICIWASLNCPETEAIATSSAMLSLTHCLLHEEFLNEGINELWDSLSSQRLMHSAGLSTEA